MNAGNGISFTSELQSNLQLQATTQVVKTLWSITEGGWEVQGRVIYERFQL